MSAAKPWSPGLCWSVWRCVAGRRYLDRPDYTEWSWRNGSIFTKAPKRSPRCAACGEKLPTGVEALFAVDTESNVNIWLGSARYLHREPCIPEPPAAP